MFNRLVFLRNRWLPLITVLLTTTLSSCSTTKPDYTTCKSYDELLRLKNPQVPKAIRITDPGTPENPTYHGFFFYNCSPFDGLQFDPSGRYMLALKVTIEGRLVQPADVAHVGFIDRNNNYKWTQVGRSTA
jgi:hypothetical protein